MQVERRQRKINSSEWTLWISITNYDGSLEKLISLWDLVSLTGEGIKFEYRKKKVAPYQCRTIDLFNSDNILDWSDLNHNNINVSIQTLLNSTQSIRFYYKTFYTEYRKNPDAS